MKKISNRINSLLISVFLLMNFSAIAQDIIVLKNGDELEAIVQEIGEVDVKYKKFDNLNGPNYTLKKSEIFMIKYANGHNDRFSEEGKPAKPENSSVSDSIGSKIYIDNICILNTYCGFQVMCYDLPGKMTWEEARAACPGGFHLPEFREIACLCEEHSPNRRVGFSYVQIVKNHGSKAYLQIDQEQYWTSSVNNRNKPVSITTNDCEAEATKADKKFYVRCIKD